MKNQKLYPLLLFVLLFVSCKKENPRQLKVGFLNAEIDMQNQKLPFVLQFTGDSGTEQVTGIKLHNGKETLELDDFEQKGDSLFIPLHIFDITLKARITENGLEGVYTKNYAEDYNLPFRAVYGSDKRIEKETTTDLFDGTYAVDFIDDQGEVSKAIGIFERDGIVMRGTFLTPTGDYRYLDGFANDQQMTLYTYDGNHAFIFTAERNNDGVIRGKFYSGRSWNESWIASPDENASLPDAYEMTYLKEGYDGIDFSFPDLEGNAVSPKDKKYQGKVLVLQIFGSWCPNCMDETRFFADWYSKQDKDQVEIIGLAYESKDDFEYAKSRVLKMKEKLNVPYDFVIAGTSSKQKASESLPMLSQVLSFPTTIFIDKKGEVRKIHTGFSGPATGKYYTRYVEEFNILMNELINE
jgi:thiol-disulfide isomerase/thioredoxin